MTLGWEESEYVFCDLQEIGRRIQKHSPDRAGKFWRAAYATFDFIAANPEIGRRRYDLQRPEIRSWQVREFNRFIIFYRVEAERVLIYRVLDGARDLNRDIAEDGKDFYASRLPGPSVDHAGVAGGVRRHEA